MIDSIKYMDWKLLRKQKQSLLEVISGQEVTTDRKDDLDGILHTIDAIQDDAVDTFGEEEIFGDLK